MADQNNASTLKSVVDQATGAAQSALGSLTGNTQNQVEGDLRQSKGEAEGELSRTAGKLGPVTATAEGGVARDHPDRQEGSWNQTIGGAKEALGNLTGADGLKQAGRDQYNQGREQEARGQLSDLGTGVASRVQGAVGAGIAGLTGDKAEQQRYNEMHDDGKAQQRGAEIDINRQN